MSVYWQMSKFGVGPYWLFPPDRYIFLSIIKVCHFPKQPTQRTVCIAAEIQHNWTPLYFSLVCDSADITFFQRL